MSINGGLIKLHTYKNDSDVMADVLDFTIAHCTETESEGLDLKMTVKS